MTGSAQSATDLVPSQPVPPILLPEILGFSPQLLLDDIINIANNAVTDTVNGMEGFVERWAEKRLVPEGEGEWDSTQEVEQGLVAFQTLLEYHTDFAFDFFEAWSLRNIFAIPPNLPLVLPHQQGLDLTQTPEREQQLMLEVDELRKKIENQRRLKRMYSRALTKSNIKRERAEKRLERLSFLRSPSMDVLERLPESFLSMYDGIASLPPLDPASITNLTQFQLTEPGKRQWETSKTGYLNWAVAQLVAKSRAQGEGGSRIDSVSARAEEIGSAEDLRALLELTEGVKMDLRATKTI